MLCVNVAVCLCISACLCRIRVGIERLEHQIDNEFFVVLNSKLEGYFHSTFGDEFCFACFFRIQSEENLKKLIALFYTGIGHMFAF